ncbi:MAG: hypothetical protein R2690_06190 [Acidimicrobiales bacterium]
MILIASDESIAEQARDEGAIAVVRHGDDDRLDVVLADLAEQFRTGERRGIDRRERPDRRVKQEWNKVTMERRSGVDRRRRHPRRRRLTLALDAGTAPPRSAISFW